MTLSWRDLILAPGGSQGDTSPPTAAKVLNTAVGLVLLVGVVCLSMIQVDTNWNWAGVWEYRMMFVLGWLATLGISVAALVLSVVGGFVLALCQRSRFLPLRYFAKVFVEFVRCMPLLVFILLVWFGFCSGRFPFTSGILILSAFEAAYISEIMRAGIESVGRSQIESARAIGLTTAQTYRYVIIPQASRQVLPPLAGQLVTLIKDSSLLSVIAIEELTQHARDAASNSYTGLEAYIPLAVGYLILTVPISLWSRWLEKRFRYET